MSARRRFFLSGEIVSVPEFAEFSAKPRAASFTKAICSAYRWHQMQMM
jgi:hypothetical protein